MKVRLFFAWYDFWVGWYWDRKKRVLYVCPLPMIVLAFHFKKKRVCFGLGIAGRGKVREDGVIEDFELRSVDLVETDDELEWMELGNNRWYHRDAFKKALEEYSEKLRRWDLTSEHEVFPLFSLDEIGVADRVAQEITSVQPLPSPAFANALKEMKAMEEMRDGKNIAHLTECEGCPECDRLMEHYAACDRCGNWGHKSQMLVRNEGDTPVVCHPCFDILEKSDPGLRRWG